MGIFLPAVVYWYILKTLAGKLKIGHQFKYIYIYFYLLYVSRATLRYVYGRTTPDTVGSKGAQQSIDAFANDVPNTWTRSKLIHFWVLNDNFRLSWCPELPTYPQLLAIIEADKIPYICRVYGRGATDGKSSILAISSTSAHPNFLFFLYASWGDTCQAKLS